MSDLFNHALSRNTDPRTSKAAAATVNVSRMEFLVLSALLLYGPMTQEETASHLNHPLPSISPRFKPLIGKRRIMRSRDHSGKLATRPGVSGRQRQIYEIQPDQALWQIRADAPETKAALRQRIEELETAIAEVRELARSTMLANHQDYTDIVDKVLP